MQLNFARRPQQSLVALLVLVFVLGGRVTADEATGTTDVKIKDLTLALPKSWKDVKSASTMRLATYNTPIAEGDKEPGELTIFSFGGGGGDVGSNISRWVGQFNSGGRSATVKKGKSGANDYYIVDVAGTYKRSIGPPIQQKTEPVEGFRMLGVILELEGKGVYYLKLTGPDATIKSQADAFRKSFGGDAKSETDFEL